jgi:DNA-binding PadR family transcriptional regulator
MAREPQTATAVLGALSIEPLTGYEVRRVISGVLGHFWHESFGQIYPCLAALEADGLVTTTPGVRRGSTVYEISAAGRHRLAELLGMPPVAQPPRNGLLLRVFFGRALPPADLDVLLDQTQREAEARLTAYAAIRDGFGTEPAYPEHGAYWEATIRAGELAAQAQLTWVAETRASLTASSRPAPDKARPGPPLGDPGRRMPT